MIPLLALTLGLSLSGLRAPVQCRRAHPAQACASPPPAGDDAPQPAESQLSFFASLRARQVAIDAEIQRRWRSAKPATQVPLTLTDWVRRLALDWPLAVCGTARGGLVVADLATGAMVACAQTAHPSTVATEEVSRSMRLLNGEYDGNGVLAVAMRGDRVASAGREGGARIWKVRCIHRTIQLDRTASSARTQTVTYPPPPPPPPPAQVHMGVLPFLILPSFIQTHHLLCSNTSSTHYGFPFLSTLKQTVMHSDTVAEGNASDG